MTYNPSTFDYNACLKLYFDDKAMCHGVLVAFPASFEPNVRSLHSLMRQKSWRDISLQCITISGAAGHLCANKLIELSLKLGILADEKNRKGSSTRLEQLKDENWKKVYIFSGRAVEEKDLEEHYMSVLKEYKQMLIEIGKVTGKNIDTTIEVEGFIKDYDVVLPPVKVVEVVEIVRVEEKPKKKEEESYGTMTVTVEGNEKQSQCSCTIF
jgi:hypothetical protein